MTRVHNITQFTKRPSSSRIGNVSFSMNETLANQWYQEQIANPPSVTINTPTLSQEMSRHHSSRDNYQDGR